MPTPKHQINLRPVNPDHIMVHEHSTFLQRLRAIWVDAGIAAVVSAMISIVVSAGVSAYFQWHGQSVREQSLRIVDSGKQFDARHNAIIAQIGVFANRLQNTGDANKEQILSAIIEAQSQLLALRARLPKQDYALLSDYAHELDNLQDALDAVKKPTDLGPVFTSAQRLLSKHDEIDNRVDRRADLAFF
ncbi:MAG: hypothetical protein ACT4OG_02765 [Alphaproteobacteria bacterium]